MFLIHFARFTNSSVDNDSYRLLISGDTAAIIDVCALPPKLSRNKNVNLLSRYATCQLRFDTKDLITLPNADNDLFIVAPSFKRAPVAPVFCCLSLPARSTKLIFDVRLVCAPVFLLVECISSDNVNTAWERLDSLFIFVDPVFLFVFPIAIHSAASFGEMTSFSTNLSTYTHFFFVSSLKSFFPDSISSKSSTFS